MQTSSSSTTCPVFVDGHMIVERLMWRKQALQSTSDFTSDSRTLLPMRTLSRQSDLPEIGFHNLSTPDLEIILYNEETLNLVGVPKERSERVWTIGSALFMRTVKLKLKEKAVP